METFFVVFSKGRQLRCNNNQLEIYSDFLLGGDSYPLTKGLWLMCWFSALPVILGMSWWNGLPCCTICQRGICPAWLQRKTRKKVSSSPSYPLLWWPASFVQTAPAFPALGLATTVCLCPGIPEQHLLSHQLESILSCSLLFSAVLLFLSWTSLIIRYLEPNLR